MKKITPLLLALFIGIITSNAQYYQWAKSMSGALSNEEGRSITVDGFGNVYTTGWFQGTVDFDPGAGTYNLTSAGNSDIFISKLDIAGNFVWTKRMGGTSSVLGGSDGDWGESIAVDASGNVYTTGHFQGTVDFDPGAGTSILTSAGSREVFISKLDAAGNFVWAKSMGGSSGEQGQSIALDAFGNVYTTGNFSGTADFDPGAGTYNLTSAGNSDIFISKLDAAGNFVWAKRMGGTNLDRCFSIAVDGFGNVYTTGDFQGTVDFDPGAGTSILTSAGGSTDIFISKLDAAGNFVWAKRMGGTNLDRGYSIAVDGSGHVYTTGYFQGTVDFDPGAGTSNLTSAGGSSDIFISKLDAAGNFVWAKRMGGTNLDRCFSIAVDTSGSIYTTGDFQGTADFDPGAGTSNLTSVGNSDIFISKLDATGNFVWAKNIGGISFDESYSIAVDGSGHVYTTGNFKEIVDFDPGAGTSILTSAGGTDIFILKLSQDLCANFSISIDSISDVSCIDSGYVLTHTNQGLHPISYSWNTTPTTNDSLITFSSPGFYTLSVTDANNCNTSTSILINGPLSNFDLNANLIATSFRPGFQSLIFLDAFNDGCDTTSGQLKLVLNPLTNYDSASIAPNSISGDTLIWNFNTLIYDSIHLSPTVYTSVDTNAVIGDIVCFDVIITPLLGDADTTNNIKQYCYPIINGYDPNDKQVYPQGECIPNFVKKDEPLTYTIRFQNTGNSNAINIHIIDSIDSNLDISTARVIGYSHPMYTELLQGNVLKFNFDSIMLPDSSSSPLASQGYVIFEIYPQLGTLNNTIVNNKSEIYFDFNPAIVTNTLMNTLIDVIPTYTTVLPTITICQGDSVLVYGSYQSIAGTYYDSLQSINGCDSVLSTTLTIDSSYLFNQNQSICQGDSMLIYGNYQSVAGTYYDSLQTINGCDSVLSITLLVNPVYLSNTNDTICQGDSVLIYGNYENTAGVYYDTLQTIFGCDSVLATTLSLNANFNISQNQSVCQGDSVLIYGNYQSVAGTYYDSLQTINGCDSVLLTTLTVNPLPNVTLANFNPDTICSNSNVVTLPNGSPSGGVYSGTGVNGGTFDPNTAGIGTHNVFYTYTDINSCINSDSTFITVEQCVGMDDLANDLGILIYPNPNTGLFTIEKSSELDKEVRISLLDATSRVIIDKLIPKGQQKVEMDITSYSKGIYYLQLTVGKEVFVKKILKN